MDLTEVSEPSSVTTGVRPERTRWIHALSGRQMLLVPVLLYLLAFYALPVARLLALSVWAGGPTLHPFEEIAGHPEFLVVLVTTFQIALSVTLAVLVLGYPVAYYLTQLSGRALAVGMLFVLLPLLTSILVRTYAWIALLGRVGVLNQLLSQMGIIHAPLILLFNRIGVYIGLVHVLLPLAILPIYSVMRGIDRGLLKAAESLGASPPKVFLNVFFPLSLPGITSGGLLVFIAAAGAFITPALLGGLRDVMIANLIADQIEKTLNWPLGAALSVMLLFVTVAVLCAYFRLSGTDRVWANRV